LACRCHISRGNRFRGVWIPVETLADDWP
jgi:hypothetical protein